jgi:hypothetical protein
VELSSLQRPFVAADARVAAGPAPGAETLVEEVDLVSVDDEVAVHIGRPQCVLAAMLWPSRGVELGQAQGWRCTSARREKDERGKHGLSFLGPRRARGNSGHASEAVAARRELGHLEVRTGVHGERPRQLGR